MIQFDPIENLPLTKSQPDPAGVITSDNGVGEAGSSSAGLFAGIGQIFANLFNYFQQKKLQKQQQEFQKEFFDYTQSAQNAEYWKRVEYDTPFRQMQRLKDAGLNMNLMYGTLGNASGLSGNAPATTAGGVTGQMPTALPYFDATSVIQSLFQPHQLMSMIGLNRSQAYKNYKSAGVDEQQAYRMSQMTPLEVEHEGKRIEETMAMKNYYETLLGKIHNENLAFDKYYQFIDEFVAAHLKDIQMGANLKESSISLQAWQQEKILHEISTLIPSQAKLNNASAEERLKAAYRIYSLTPSEKRKLAAEADLTEEQYNWFITNKVIGPLLMAGLSFLK